jgi:hypothetical protein
MEITKICVIVISAVFRSLSFPFTMIVKFQDAVAVGAMDDDHAFVSSGFDLDTSTSTTRTPLKW